MEFQKIKYSEKSGVELVQKIKAEGGVTELREFSCAQPPLPELPAALKAFRDFVISLLPLRDDEKQDNNGNPDGKLLDDLVVTTLSIDEEPKSHRRGLIVTAVLPIEQASGRPLVLNTPRMREWEDDGEGEQPAGTFGPAIAQLIDAAQAAATKYYKGERGQAEMFTQEETTKAPVSTPAEGRSEAPLNATGDSQPVERKRGPRRTRIKEVEGAGRVMNPEASVPPTDEVIRKQLLVSGVDVPVERIAKWVSSDRESALKWAADPDGNAPPFVVRRDMVTLAEVEQGNGALQEATTPA